MLRLAIVADDLTGALDASAPFAARGLRTMVVTDMDALDPNTCDAEVLCVCTSSREILQAQAAERVSQAVQALASLGPVATFKKIDSRLKGHVAVETSVAAKWFGRHDIIVAPAIPALGRTVRDGKVCGTGVSQPIDIAKRFSGLDVSVPDTPDQASLDGIVAGQSSWSSRLFVGANGLATALAARMSPQVPRRPDIPAGRFVIAIGSRDPVTLRQVAPVAAIPGAAFVTTADGDLPSTDPASVMICQAVIPETAKFGVAMSRFAVSIADRLEQDTPGCALISGGETAQSVLSALGVTRLQVAGEVLPGIAMSWVKLGGRRLALITKSGGFGQPDALARIVHEFLGRSHAVAEESVGDNV